MPTRQGCSERHRGPARVFSLTDGRCWSWFLPSHPGGGGRRPRARLLEGWALRRRQRGTGVEGLGRGRSSLVRCVRRRRRESRERQGIKRERASERGDRARVMELVGAAGPWSRPSGKGASWALANWCGCWAPSPFQNLPFLKFIVYIIKQPTKGENPGVFWLGI